MPGAHGVLQGSSGRVSVCLPAAHCEPLAGGVAGRPTLHGLVRERCSHERMMGMAAMKQESGAGVICGLCFVWLRLAAAALPASRTHAAGCWGKLQHQVTQPVSCCLEVGPSLSHRRGSLDVACAPSVLALHRWVAERLYVAPCPLI
jgi:hypothetical protein